MPATPPFPLASVIASNATFRPPYPTAIFAGIGQGTLEEFARHLDGRAHIIIVGRRPAHHRRADCAPPPRHAQLPRPVPWLHDRRRVHPHRRWARPQAPRALRALAAPPAPRARAQRARGAPCDTADLGLRKHYAHNGLMVQAFAARHPALAFVHACPGAVRGPGIMASSPSRVVRLAQYVVGALAPLFSVAPGEAEGYMLYVLLRCGGGDGSRGAGAGSAGRIVCGRGGGCGSIL